MRTNTDTASLRSLEVAFPSSTYQLPGIPMPSLHSGSWELSTLGKICARGRVYGLWTQQPNVIQTWVRTPFIIHISYASSSFDPWTLHPNVFEMFSRFPFLIT